MPPKIFTDDSILLNLSNIDGNYRNCILSGTLSPSQDANLIFFDCMSGTSGLTTPIIDMNGISGSQVSFRSYSGGIKFINITDSSFLSTIEFVAGKFHIDSSSNAGFISVRGVASITNNSSTTTIETGSLINAGMFNNITAAPDPTLSTKVDELHIIHGLNDSKSLTVNLTERTAGEVTQSINYNSGSNETIVTRIP